MICCTVRGPVEAQESIFEMIKRAQGAGGISGVSADAVLRFL